MEFQKHGLLKTRANPLRYRGTMTLKKGLANSVNTMSARLIDMVGPQNVIRLAKSAGITNKIPAGPAIALGSVELTLYEMVVSLWNVCK